MTRPKTQADGPAMDAAQLHTRWLEVALGGELPSEPHATCESCVMLAVPDGADAYPHAVFFNPRTKCCTYLPRLPNFLVGAILADEAADMAEGRARVLERIGKKIGVTPLFVGAGGPYAVLYDSGEGVFGHSETMRCPYYLEDRIGGGCGIWRHRNSVCRTWFCKHERGATAKRFWDSANDLLMAVEESLAIHCLVTVGLDDAALRANVPLRVPPSRQKTGAVTADELDGTVSPRSYGALWGSWAGREEEFYRRCTAIVRDLEWAEVERIGGASIALLLRLARAAYGAVINDEVPERLEVGYFNVIGMGRETVRLATYSSYDPVDVSAALLPVLPAFDGSRVPDALRVIERDHGLILRPQLVRKLVDYDLLRAAEAIEPAGVTPQPTSPAPLARARKRSRRSSRPSRR